MTYNESVQKLRDLHINTPEVICAFPQATTRDIADQVNAVLLATAERLTRNVIVRTVGTSRYLDIRSLSATDLYNFIKVFDNYGSYITIFKAPTSKAELRGYCIPHPYWNKFVAITDYVHHDYKATTVWGQPMDQFPFPVGIRNPARLVNEALVNQRMELDGQEIEFTYHLNPEGELKQHILFWGMRSPSYEE